MIPLLYRLRTGGAPLTLATRFVEGITKQIRSSPTAGEFEFVLRGERQFQIVGSASCGYR